MTLSVVMPYWDRQDQLTRAMRLYERLYVDEIDELIVCDDGTPEPATVLPWVTLVRLPRKPLPLNPCVPINRAVAVSTGDVIVLTTPEIEHRERVLPDMLKLLEHGDDYVVSPCFDAVRGWLAGPKCDYSRGGRLPVPDGSHFHFLAVFRRSLWDKAGGFDERYRHGQGCDDNDWLWRLHEVGARFKTSDTVVYHNHGVGLEWGLPHNRELLRATWGHLWT